MAPREPSAGNRIPRPLAVALAAALAGRGGVAQEPPRPDPDPARAFAERIARHAGGAEALRRLGHVAFRETKGTTRRGAVHRQEADWLLASAMRRARREVAGPADERRDIMVLDTDSRRNLLTVPDRPGPRVSLWSEWHRVRRHLFLPLEILDPGAKLTLLPKVKDDPTSVRRLLVDWPDPRNYDTVDRYEIVAEVDTGRIVRTIAITGSRGQFRTVHRVTRWTRVGGLRLPTAFELEDGRGSSLFFTLLRAGVAIPPDAFSRETRLIAGLTRPRKDGGDRNR